ncbi:MAG: FG-GAP repeat domain-containing protein [Deltaproteobacteria bacterium]
MRSSLALLLLAFAIPPTVGVRPTGWSPEAWQRTDRLAGLTPSCVLVVDAQRRGRPDVVVTDASSNDLRLLPALGSGRFGHALTLATGLGPMAVAAGPLDQSGRLALVVANSHIGSLSLFLPMEQDRATQGFAPRVDLPVGVMPTHLALADVNGDGKLDAVVADPGAGTLALLLGDGKGNLTLSSRIPVAPGISRVGVGDLNRDGRADIIALNPRLQSLSVFLGRTDGTFSVRQDFAAGPSPSAFALGDLNGDGRLDAVVANGGTNTISLLYGDGKGGFAPPVTLLAGMFPSAVAIGDFDGDGLPDLAVASAGLNSVWLYHNLGGGRFDEPTTVPVGLGPAWLALGDLDGDGRLDIAVANARANSVSLLLQR